jgi:hypothetical protein
MLPSRPVEHPAPFADDLRARATLRLPLPARSEFEEDDDLFGDDDDEVVEVDDDELDVDELDDDDFEAELDD